MKLNNLEELIQKIAQKTGLSRGEIKKKIDCCRKTYITKIINHDNYFKLVTSNESVKYNK